MRVRFRRFLSALLMLVLPLQGLAFASMLELPAAPQPQALQQLAADDGMEHCHEPARPDQAGQHACKHCAACALGAALPAPIAAGLAAQPAPRSFAAHADTP